MPSELAGSHRVQGSYRGLAGSYDETILKGLVPALFQLTSIVSHQLQQNRCIKVPSMSRKETNDVTLDSEIDFIQTPVPKASAFATTESCGIPLTDVSLSIILTLPDKLLISYL